MLTENHLTDLVVTSPCALIKYYQWNIAANGEPLNIIFKKTISNGSKASKISADTSFSILRKTLKKQCSFTAGMLLQKEEYLLKWFFAIMQVMGLCTINFARQA
jgi:hypothetical protein